MKKIMLALVIVVLISTPSLANEIEPNGIFSLHGTEWIALSIALQIFPFPSLVPLYTSAFGFYQHAVYYSVGDLEWGFNYASYLDLLVCSIFHGTHIYKVWSRETTTWNGILFPIGIGIVVEYFRIKRYNDIFPVTIELKIGLLVKTDDNWTPPEFE
jgi:hypothetical protein